MRRRRSGEGDSESKCPKCNTHYPKCSSRCHPRARSRHHVYPKRYFHGEGPVRVFCRRCHDQLERMIPFAKRSKRFYHEIISLFMKGARSFRVARRRRNRANINVGLMGHQYRRCA